MEGRDMSVRYTREEIQDILQKVRKLPTFDGEYIYSKDFAAVKAAMKYKRTPEQILAYEEYYNKYYDGKIGIAELEDLLDNHTSASAHAGWYARKFDVDKDGYISKEEFEAVHALMSIEWNNIAPKESFHKFVREADTDKSGKVDIAEFTAWLAKHGRH